MLQVQSIMGSQFAYRSSLHALQVAVQHAGVSGLFRGYWATNSVWLPWNMIYITTYERLKVLAAASLAFGTADTSSSGRGTAPPAHDSDAPSITESVASKPGSEAGSSGDHGPRDSQPPLPSWAIAGCSATAAGFAALVTHPADVVKTRLQVLSGTQEGKSLTAVRVARQLLRQEGAAALLKGCAARIMTIAPGSALSWALYETIKPKLTNLTVDM